MSYPLSSPVVEGQATEAAQYNNLRADALYMGNEPSASGTVRDLLFSAASNYSMVQVGRAQIKVPATAMQPVGLAIGGAVYTVTADVSLTVSADTTPNAGRYAVYAIGNAGTFSLALAAGNNSRVVGYFCWDGTGIIPGTVHTSAEWALMGLKRPEDAAGRLSLASDPVPDVDIDMGTVLNFLPYNGNEIGLKLYGEWEYFTWQSLTLTASGLIRELPYDVFLSADANGLGLEAVPWISSANRGTGALAFVDGIRVSGSNAGKRFLGTFVINAGGYFEDSRSARLLWNENNRVSRSILQRLSTQKGQGVSHMGSWAPYFDEDAPTVRLLIAGADVDFSLIGIGISSMITETDAGYNRAACIGIVQDCVMDSPWTGNQNAVPVFTHTCSKGPVSAELTNYDPALVGYHGYTLAFWSNYSFYPMGKSLNAGCGEVPGLYGKIWA
jgi:hypothetical protein